MTPHSLSTSDLEYHLPEQQIATTPAQPRDSARMMVVHRSHDLVSHLRVSDLPDYLSAGDHLVFNTTAVLPARLSGHRLDTGGGVGGLYLHDEQPQNENCWRVMLHSNGTLRPGQQIRLDDEENDNQSIILELLEKKDREWVVRPTGSENSSGILNRIGHTPLPPYIIRARRHDHLEIPDSNDRAWYQTVYADENRRGSVAAPTAGLHFTPDLLKTVHHQGINRLDLTLQVGAGTFQPVTATTLDEHPMHTEYFEIPPETINRVSHRVLPKSQAQDMGRIIAVGTTSVRALESLPHDLSGSFDHPMQAETNLLIAPPYKFRFVDGMLTNFHLPRSTLLALVAAMIGLDRLKDLYRIAIEQKYRFYSYGDAMLILP